MDEKAADVLTRRKAHGLLSVTRFYAIVLLTERDSIVISADDAAVRDGHAVCVTTEISQHRLGTTEGRFGIHCPAVVCLQTMRGTAGSVKTKWKYSTGSKSSERAAIQSRAAGP